MKKDKTSAKSRAMLASWLGGLAFILSLFAVGCFVFEFGKADHSSLPFLLRLGALIALGYSAYWMRFGWVRMVEGAYLHAEYGGTGNLLQRIIFRNREPWELSQPLPLPLNFKSNRDGCVLYVSVWENFLGANKIMCRMINMYTGENVCPWDDLDGPY